MPEIKVSQDVTKPFLKRMGWDEESIAKEKQMFAYLVYETCSIRKPRPCSYCQKLLKEQAIKGEFKQPMLMLPKYWNEKYVKEIKEYLSKCGSKERFCSDTCLSKFHKCENLK